jgi:hypothetical protein
MPSPRISTNSSQIEAPSRIKVAWYSTFNAPSRDCFFSLISEVVGLDYHRYSCCLSPPKQNFFILFSSPHISTSLVFSTMLTSEYEFYILFSLFCIIYHNFAKISDTPISNGFNKIILENSLKIVIKNWEIWQINY